MPYKSFAMVMAEATGEWDFTVIEELLESLDDFIGLEEYGVVIERVEGMGEAS